MRRLFCLILLCLLPFPSLAVEKIYKVGVALGEPFVIARDGDYHGISVDIWKLLAIDQNLNYEFVEMGEHIDDSINALQVGNIDILIGPIVPTFERIKQVDFTQPYFLNQMGIVVPIKNVNFFRALGTIFEGNFKWVLLFFLIFFIVYIHIFWFYERKTHYYNVNQNYADGILKVFWLHTLDIGFTRPPTHRHTRIIRFFWIVIVALFFTSITASITSALTIAVSKSFEPYDDLSDFENMKIAAVISTAPHEVGIEKGLRIIPVDNREVGIDLLLQNKVGGFIDYYSIADYYLKENKLHSKLMMANVIVQQDTFAFALPINSPLRIPLNLKLSSLQNYGLIKPICEKYFVQDSRSAQNCDI